MEWCQQAAGWDGSRVRQGAQAKGAAGGQVRRVALRWRGTCWPGQRALQHASWAYAAQRATQPIPLRPCIKAPHRSPAIMRPLISTPSSMMACPSIHTARYRRCLPWRKWSGPRRLPVRLVCPVGFRWKHRPARVECTRIEMHWVTDVRQGQGIHAAPGGEVWRPCSRGTSAVHTPPGGRTWRAKVAGKLQK